MRIYALSDTGCALLDRTVVVQACPSYPWRTRNESGLTRRKTGFQHTIKEAVITSQSHPAVIIYTTPTCPDCWSLKAWLKRNEIAYEERDLSDSGIMAEAKARTGVRVAPITLVGRKVFYGTFLSQQPGLTAALGLSNVA